MSDLTIIEDDLSGAAIGALLALHLDDMRQWSPPGTVHALPPERLRQPDVTFYSAWAPAGDDGEALAGCGALKRLDAVHAEIKSMRVAPARRGTGVGKAILHHLLGVARARGHTRVSLETGRTEPFAPARGLYRANGFTECPPFADYASDGFSICMTRAL